MLSTTFSVFGLRLPSGGGTIDFGNGVVARKSVSSPLIPFSPLVSYHRPSPPLRSIFSPPVPKEIGPVAPPKPVHCTIHVSSSASPSNSHTRSQGSTIKSPVMASYTSGSLNISAVPLVRVRSLGAIMSGRGAGKLVRYGFCDRAASIASRDSGGVTSEMAANPIQSGLTIDITEVHGCTYLRHPFCSTSRADTTPWACLRLARELLGSRRGLK